MKVTRDPSFDGELITLPIDGQFHLQAHFYRYGLTRAISASRPDFLYIEEEPYSMVAAQATAIARRLHIRSALYSCQNLSKKRAIYLAKAIQRLGGGHQKLIAITGKVEEVWSPCFDSIHVVPLAVNTATFQPNKDVRATMRRQWAISDNSIVLGFTGRLVQEKGLLTFAEAFKQLSLRHRDVYAVIVGNGPLRREVEQAFDGLPASVVGYVPHAAMHEWMIAWDILVLPSESKPGWTEQFGRVIVEAASCGIPTVGSDCGEIPNLVGALGGWVFPEGAADILFERLSEAVQAVRRTPIPWTHLRTTVDDRYGKREQARRLLKAFSGSAVMDNRIASDE